LSASASAFPLKPALIALEALGRVGLLDIDELNGLDLGDFQFGYQPLQLSYQLVLLGVGQALPDQLNVSLRSGSCSPISFQKRL
jgi:hypothetical protein